MASRIKAINALRPRIARGRTVQTPELVDYVARSSSLSEGQLMLALTELRDAVVFFNRHGRGVRLEGHLPAQPAPGRHARRGAPLRLAAAPGAQRGQAAVQNPKPQAYRQDAR
jgi:hypothetical protein